MASSRMIATRKRPVFMSHICSKCGFPMISVVQIESEAQKTYTFSQEKASQIASDTAENAIEDEIRRIESCRRDRVVLVGKLKKGSMISPGYFCDASFSGHQTRCPYCGNLEPWKGASVKKDVSTMEAALKKLSQQEEKYTAELNDALNQYTKLQEQSAKFDPDELQDARLALRPAMERSAIDCVQSAYGDKYDPLVMRDSKRDVANLLNENVKDRPVRKFLRQQHPVEQRKKDRESERE